jgi:hypothetical protein
LCLPSGLFPSGFPTSPLSPIRATCPVRPTEHGIILQALQLPPVYLPSQKYPIFGYLNVVSVRSFRASLIINAC